MKKIPSCSGHTISTITITHQTCQGKIESLRKNTAIPKAAQPFKQN